MLLALLALKGSRVGLCLVYKAYSGTAFACYLEVSFLMVQTHA